MRGHTVCLHKMSINIANTTCSVIGAYPFIGLHGQHFQWYIKNIQVTLYNDICLKIAP